MDEFLLNHPTERLPSPEVPSATANEEAVEKLRLEIHKRRAAYVEKAQALKNRIQTEQAKLEELEKDLDPEAEPTSALFKHVQKQTALLQSVIKNYNIATNGHNGGKYLTDIPMAQSNVADIESRLRSVEVALQGSIEHEVKENEPDVTGAEAEKMETGYPVDGLYTMLTPLEFMGSIQFDPDQRFTELEGVADRARSLPPVGYYKV